MRSFVLVIKIMNERDRDFINKCFDRMDSMRNISIRNITKHVVYSEANSFYCSENTIRLIIENKYFKGLNNSLLMERNNLIRIMADKIKSDNPNISIGDIVQKIYTSKAPRFYIKENSAMLLFYKSMRNRKKKCLNTLSRFL